MDYATCLATDPYLVRDTRAPDGLMAGGWRVVRKGGWVRGFGAWWQDDRLIPFAGVRVWLDDTDYWNSECTAYTERHVGDTLICGLYNGKDKRDSG